MSGFRKTADKLARDKGHDSIAEVIAGYRDLDFNMPQILAALENDLGIIASPNTVRAWEAAK